MTHPNIILVVSDQHRGDWLGSAGNRVVHTPNLDRLAGDGAAFTQAYCSSPLCVPSRMSLMTGREPHHIDVHGNDDYLASDVPTFAHALALAGYDTVLCGRMHFLGPDQRHGFRERLVGDITPSYPGGPKTDYRHLRGTPDPDRIAIDLAGPGDSPVIDFDAAVVTACEDYLRDRAHSAGDTPLLMTVGLYGPHAPFTCPPSEFEPALDAVEAHDRVIPVDGDPHPHVAQQRRNHRLESVTPAQTMMVRANYAGMVNHLDRNIGRIIEAAAALVGETILVYVSDHGEMAGDHGLFWKRSFYEPSVRVPMIWCVLDDSSRRHIAGGRRIAAPVSLMDLAPTLARIAGAPELPNCDGHDLRPLLRGIAGGAETYAERPVHSQLVVRDRQAVRMVRSTRFKLTYYHGSSRHQLFDVSEDPDETNDLGTDPSYDNVRSDLIDLARRGWDAESILLGRTARAADKAFMHEWGERVGLGRLDLWDETGPFFATGTPDSPATAITTTEGGL